MIHSIRNDDARSGRAPGHTRLILRSLAVMAHHKGPAAFFDFADETAGLMRTTQIRLPGWQHEGEGGGGGVKRT
jgi:hypothetical protein